MKTALEFEMGDIDDELRLRQCLNASNLAQCLCDIAQQLRQTLKRGAHAEDAYKVVEAVQDRFYKTLEEYDLDLDDLTY